MIFSMTYMYRSFSFFSTRPIMYFSRTCWLDRLVTNRWRTFCMIGSQESAMLCSYVEHLLRNNNAGNSSFYLSGIWSGCYWSSSFFLLLLVILTLRFYLGNRELHYLIPHAHSSTATHCVNCGFYEYSHVIIFPMFCMFKRYIILILQEIQIWRYTDTNETLSI